MKNFFMTTPCCDLSAAERGVLSVLRFRPLFNGRFGPQSGSQKTAGTTLPLMNFRSLFSMSKAHGLGMNKGGFRLGPLPFQ